jgi:hypothetical protein
LIEELWIRHDYLTLKPSLLSDYLGTIAMEPQRRESLLTPGDQFGLDKGFRIGFGYDLEKTLNGLARAEALMRTLM